jgi:hypothetical protein
MLNLLDGTQGKTKAKKSRKEKLPDYFKGKATVLELCLKLLVIIFKTNRWDLSLS